ncbi:hypothetical protein, partial [Salmonella enterica]|uniref:hypothetical protein n=1 Tax=Salmonella enterica TaxID=28901 RepID=UPI0026659538
LIVEDKAGEDGAQAQHQQRDQHDQRAFMRVIATRTVAGIMRMMIVMAMGIMGVRRMIVMPVIVMGMIVMAVAMGVM